jgi:predicted dithiol-disulfide oxidoreductase (DUF899 family)
MTSTHEARTEGAASATTAGGTATNDTAPSTAAVPPVVDRETWLREREELLTREKEHTRRGDAIAAARRRMSMTEVDAQHTVTGPDGPRSLLDLFEGREELLVYRHMWHSGEPFENQCPGCTFAYWAVHDPVYLRARGVSFAVLAQGPWDEVAPFVEFMGYPPHWYSASGIDDPALYGEDHGWVSLLRQGDRVFLTNTVGGRGAELAMPELALLDLTPRGRMEAWQDSPAGWPEGRTPGWFWKADEDRVGNGWAGGRPTAQWTRPGATPVAPHSGHHHH